MMIITGCEGNEILLGRHQSRYAESDVTPEMIRPLLISIRARPDRRLFESAEWQSRMLVRTCSSLK